MAYYNSQPPMAGLSSALAMQGRMGDSTLVHMNPMEVEMLKTMSPDGSLSINPETGLPEAFKLRDIAAFALPIAASIAMPYLAPALVGSIGAVGAGAVGAGLGGVGSGLIQGKGLKDSLVQGGISGLMSYGMGSMMAPGTVTGGAGAIQGGTTAAPIADVAGSGLMAPSNTSVLHTDFTGGFDIAQPVGATATTMPDAASIAQLTSSAPAAGTPTHMLADTPLSPLAPKGSVPRNLLTDKFVPDASETMSGRGLGWASRNSPFGNTAIDGSPLGATQVPTYTQIGGSALGSAGKMYMDSMLSPEEMPYDIAGDDAYYDADLEGGRERGRENARTLRQPFESIDPSEYYGMATSPGGIGTFYAAEGGRVPKDVDINGQPHQLSYINQEEANLLQNLGGSGREVFGIPAYLMGGEEGMGADGESNGTADGMGVGGYSDAQAAAVAASLGDAATQGVGSSTQSRGAISAAPPDIGPLGRGALGLIGLSPHGYSVNPDMTFNTVTGLSIPGITNAALSAMGKDTSLATVTGPTQSPGGGDIGDNDDGGVGDVGGDSGVYGRPYGDPYNTSRPATMAQGGGIASLAYGGNPPPTGYANQAFEGTVPGAGTGMSDSVPFSIEGDQPALLSRDEYVLPADVVSQLGDGSSGAGSDMLDNFISQVRQTKYGNTHQPPPVGPQLMTGLMHNGGIV